MTSRRRTLLLALPALVLAGIGTVHPHHLDPGSAQWWSDLHIILLPIFPLLGVVQWVLLDRVSPVPRWAGRLAAFGYAAFYGGLDAVAGIAAGTLVHAQGRRSDLDLAVFQVGDLLGYVGSGCFLVANVIIVVALGRRVGPAVYPGGAVLLTASAFFLVSHIFWPVGVATMLGLAAGTALVDGAAARAGARPPAAGVEGIAGPDTA